MKLKASMANKQRQLPRVRAALVKPGASMAMSDRRSFGDIKRRALSVSDLSLSVDVVDIRQARGFAPVDLEYQVLAWPEL